MEHSSIAGGSTNLYSHFGNQYNSSSENWESTYPKTQLYHSWPCTQRMLNHITFFSGVFIAALFIIARTWKQSRCPSTKEWKKKMWYIYTMEYYPMEINNDTMTFTGKWIELEKKYPE